MKLRSLFLFGAGVAAGLAIANKLHEDDPEVVHGPSKQRAPANPALRVASTSAQRIADRATVASLDAIRRARASIRERLADDSYDDAAWS
ncbi:MAG TPA: hypothetical protein VH720_00535 [Candidatus Limnocylindrales bacterium]|jgi:hypothetical protein